VSERPDLESVDHEHAQQLAGLEHGDPEHGPDRVYLDRSVAVLGIGEDVVNVNGAPLESGAGRTAVTSGRERILLDERHELSGGIERRDRLQKLTVEPEDERALRLAQPD